MGNKRIIIQANGKRRKVCAKTQKALAEKNFCWCGRKRCWEGSRITSEKALCKIRGFREKFRLRINIDDEKIEFDDAESV